MTLLVKCSNIAKRMCCTVREVCAKFTSMPLSLRVCEEEVKARMGLVECVNHNLVEPALPSSTRNTLWHLHRGISTCGAFILMLVLCFLCIGLPIIIILCENGLHIAAV
ncbi:uncharacterized protein LOC135333792 isoform X2 [Halichondria panicea]|uniref:uncharacterized protein LOC135333792 isoform X2 n=1 Tax=Halichondria panicea TaxID=6063 RepID=UPI00312BC60A